LGLTRISSFFLDESGAFLLRFAFAHGLGRWSIVAALVKQLVGLLFCTWLCRFRRQAQTRKIAAAQAMIVVNLRV
jgi:hypothetical protein